MISESTYPFTPLGYGTVCVWYSNVTRMLYRCARRGASRCITVRYGIVAYGTMEFHRAEVMYGMDLANSELHGFCVLGAVRYNTVRYVL